ncbi:MAG: RNA polymerase sigma factor [Kofleriaceae bacterium]
MTSQRTAPDGKLLPFKRVQGSVAELSDRALVSAVAQGDPAALGALFDRFQRDVHRFVARLVRDNDNDLDDLVQTTFLQAYRSAPRFRSESAVKTWLFGIAANLVRHHTRSEIRRRAAASNLTAVPDSPLVTPGDAITIEQQRRMIAVAVERLSPALKEVYVLCVVEELPGKDAAAALGIREASLWRRLTDARAALRVTIEELQR